MAERVSLRPLGTLAALVVSLGLAAACSDDPPAPPTPSPTEALWNPCDGLRLDRVQRDLGVTLTSNTGTSTAPQCTFTPDDDGDPAIDVNYQLYPGTLDELFDDFGEVTGRTVDVDLPDADAARLVSSVSEKSKTLAITGFVQNGDLVQIVNAIDPSPYDRARLGRTVRAIMRDLAAHADESGLSGN